MTDPHPAPQRLPHGRRPPRGGLAPPARRPARAHRPRALPGAGAGPPSAAGSTRCSSPTAWPCGPNVRAQRPGGVRAAHPAVRASPAATEHVGPHRDRVHHLQRAVPRGPHVRLARPHQRRPRRLEHRHLGDRRGGRATSASTSIRAHADRYGRAAEFLDVARRSGTAGRTTRSVLDTAQRRLRRRRQGPPRRTTRASTSGSPARSTSRAPRRAARCWCRPGSSEDGQGVRRAVRRGRVHRAADPRRGAGVLRGPQGRALAAYGRRPERPAVLPGIAPFIGADRGRGPRAGAGAHGPASPRTTGCASCPGCSAST